MKLFISSLSKGLVALVLTFFVYQFFYIEFIRSSVEDAAFDTLNWFALSKTEVDTSSPHVFILMVDDNYLKSKELLDEHNETRYGYLFPRQYIVEIIASLDALVAELDEENYPQALFVDYDVSYLSDPLNKTKMPGDIALIEALKQDRPYTIYLPMTSSYNFIYFSDDPKIQEKIKNKRLIFVSVGLTTASDDISRRYYPYEVYKNREHKDELFPNIAVSLWNKENDVVLDVNTSFEQVGLSLIENRIIFKEDTLRQKDKSVTWQSKWTKLSGMSAHYPLDMIYEESIKDAIFMLGATHSVSKDVFDIDAFDKSVSGVEMHANALMTLYYLNGHLVRLSLISSLLIIFVIITLLDFALGLLYVPLKGLVDRLNTKRLWPMLMLLKKILLWGLSERQSKFRGYWLIPLSLLILGFVSYELLVQKQLWFNWLIPSLMSITYIVTMLMLKPFRKK